MLLLNQQRASIDGDNDTVFVLKHIKQVVNPLSRVESTMPSELSSPRTHLSLSRSGSKPNIPQSGSNPNLYGSSSLLRDTSSNITPNAVAIYEYRAEREDELDVAIGDRFVILSRETGWCVVEKDGKRGDKSIKETGWVPTGCLHESEVEAQDEGALVVLGVVLYDYSKISPNELSIKKEIPSSFIKNTSIGYWQIVIHSGVGYQGTYVSFHFPLLFPHTHSLLTSCYVSCDQDLNDPVDSYLE